MGTVVHQDTDIMNSTVPCEPRLIIKHNGSYRLCLQRMMREAIGKTPSIYSGRKERVFALAGCGMGKVIVHGMFSRQGEYLQQLKFFAYWFQDLPLFLENSPISEQALISRLC